MNDLVAEIGGQVAVADLLGAELTEHAFVLHNFGSLEFVNNHVAVLDGNEINQLSEIINRVIGGFDVGLQGQLRAVLGGLALEEVLETGLVHL